MKFRFAPVVFMAAFSCAYGVVFAKNWPLFNYYPVPGTFSWRPTALKGIGPAMAWYGMMTSAGIVALALSLCIPDRVLAKPLNNLLWIFPCGAMLTCAYLLKHFFA